jgi:BolA protein
MSVQQQIKTIIESTFAPTHLEVINQSDNHIGHAGHDGSGESHFKLMVVSPLFEDVSRIDRSRQVNQALEPVFTNGLHALSMKLVAPSEYGK